jgi:hypothetical protein
MDKSETFSLEVTLESERQKCLKEIQHYYQKYGSEEIKKLRSYLLQLCETEPADLEDIRSQLALLEDYA